MPILDELLISGLTTSGGIALDADGKTWSYEQLSNQVQRLAQALTASGAEPGDRVAVLLLNCPELVIVYLACFRAGLIVVPMDYRYHVPQLNYALRHSGTTVLIAHAERLDEIDECDARADLRQLLVVNGDRSTREVSLEAMISRHSGDAFETEPRGDDLAVIFYTSGTTSRPKGVTLTRDAIAAGILKSRAAITLTSEDVTLIAAPVSRPMALRTQLLPTLYAGGTVRLLRTFNSDMYIQALSRPGTTFIALLPSALRHVLFHNRVKECDFSSLRICLAGGDHVPLSLHERFQELTGQTITEQCGMTETGPYAVNPPFGRGKSGSIGLPFYGVQVCVVGDDGLDLPWGQAGQILVRGPLQMDGYWNDTAQTRRILRDGWIRTGDIGRFDEDGYLWFVGREKEIIVRDGSNISPIQIESELECHPGVAEAAVVAVDDDDHGQVPHAFVTLWEDADVEVTDLRKQLTQRMPEYMIPETITLVDRMPRTGAGKIDRGRLSWVPSLGTAAFD